MVPNGWRLKHLSELTTRISDGIHSTPKYADKSSVFFINGNNLKNGSIVIQDTTKCVDEDDAKNHCRELTDRTILMSINGTIGNLAYYRGEPVVLGKSACYINVGHDADVDFIYFALSDSRIQNFYESELTGTTIRNLSLKSIKATRIYTPPLDEQKKIAKILSTLDKVIATVEKLINNSQQQKKALMQQLLTGKKRLPGFGREWIKSTLFNVADVVMGSSPKSEAYNDNKEGLPLLQGNADIKQRLSAPRVYTTQITKECIVGDVLLSVRAPVGEVSRSVHHACIGRGIAAIRAKHGVSQEYLYQWLLYIEPRWARLSQGSTFESVNGNDIKGLHIDIPSEDEQQKIAHVLTATDHETKNLKKQLEHLKQEKKALIQQLLAGKRRVTVNQ